MNKILTSFLQEYNLTYDKKEKVFYGEVSGMQMSGSFSSFAAQNLLTFHIRLREETVEGARQYIFGISKSYGILRFDIAGDGIVCVLQPNARKYVACAQDLVNYFKALEVKGGCPFCGEELGSNAILVGSANGIYRTHEKCFDEYVESVKGEEAAIKAAPSNLGKAICGMLLGALVGCAVFAVFFALGFISWWAPIICGFLGAFLWDKFGGKNDKKKIICIWLITIVFLMVTLFLCYYVFILNEMNGVEGASEIGGVLYWFKLLWNEMPEFRSACIQDFVLSFLIIVVADVFVTVQIARTQQVMSKTFRKLS